MTIPVLVHWQVEQDADDCVWLGLNHADQRTNVLSKAVMRELSIMLDWMESGGDYISGAVIYSAKDKGFIAGADIHEFVAIENEDQALSLVMDVQILFDRIEQLAVPTVAMIDGFCFGGGTELALACQYRVACSDASTKIGLPEVKLGIHPGWGGTVRLPKLVGTLVAMEAMLSGRAYSGYQAKKMGLVDVLVPRRHLRHAAIDCLSRGHVMRRQAWSEGLINSGFFRPLVARLLIRQLRKKRVNPDHYPAPYAMVDNWFREGLGERAMDQEAHSVASLIRGSTSRHLVQAFFLQESLKAKGEVFATQGKRVHVIGAGVMGGDIACWCAFKGMSVTLHDQNVDVIAVALKRAYAFFHKKLRHDKCALQGAMDRFIPDLDGGGVAGADVVIEAIVEDLTIKQGLFQSLEPQLKPGAILATNTSSIPLEALASCLREPERLVGIHFFNPVAKMQLVEVIHQGDPKSDGCVGALNFVRSIDKLPLPVASSPGFLVNRVLMPYLLESMHLMADGVSPGAIDKAACAFGMPMGPIALADAVGLDICLAVCRSVGDHLGYDVPELLLEKVDAGHLGRKSGRGFYRYRRGHARRPMFNRSKYTQEALQDRLIKCLTDEAEACLREGLVASSDDINAGILFGIGFAPFRGGILVYDNE
jgi:3-hydroxyacyl-CoA dehydrogenase / enoyl-CoA hydratase / 3-hydroxybutyryl-CoA epimerase